MAGKRISAGGRARANRRKTIKPNPFMPDGRLKKAQHELYAQTFAQTFSTTEAITAIGRANSNKAGPAMAAYELTRAHPEISERIAEIIRLRAKDLAIDESWIVLQLHNVFTRASQAEPVRDNEGNETGEYQFDGRTSTRTLELLGQHLGMFEKNKGKDVGGGVVINLNYGGAQAPKLAVARGITIDQEPDE